MIHFGMPTLRPRHQVTEIDELAEALDAAQGRWPDLSRGQLITRLALEGHRAIVSHEGAEQTDRVAALAEHRGALTGTYPPGQLAELREDWPE